MKKLLLAGLLTITMLLAITPPKAEAVNGYITHAIYYYNHVGTHLLPQPPCEPVTQDMRWYKDGDGWGHNFVTRVDTFTAEGYPISNYFYDSFGVPQNGNIGNYSYTDPTTAIQHVETTLVRIKNWFSVTKRVYVRLTCNHIDPYGEVLGSPTVHYITYDIPAMTELQTSFMSGIIDGTYEVSLTPFQFEA